MKIVKRTPAQQAAYLAALISIEQAAFDPIDNGRNLQAGEIYLANEARFSESFYSEPLTAYSVGFKDPNNIEDTVEFFAPGIETPRFFEYKEAINAEEFYSELDEDMRAPGSAFKMVEPYKGVRTVGKTVNRGLTLRVDRDLQTSSDWDQKAVAKLLRRILRNKLRRAIALLSAAATNTAKTWDVTAGKDPDQDVLSDLITANTASGIYPNRVGYGHTAWAKRILAHRAQNSAGGFASAGMTPEQVAGFLGIDRAYVSKERYQSAAAAKTEIVANLVLMFMALDGADTEDSSNIKGFYSLCANGQRYATYIQQVSAKLWDVTVEHYELTKITSTLGIRKFTVS